jgi:hypothetical protein
LEEGRKAAAAGAMEEIERLTRERDEARASSQRLTDAALQFARVHVGLIEVLLRRGEEEQRLAEQRAEHIRRLHRRGFTRENTTENKSSKQ